MWLADNNIAKEYFEFVHACVKNNNINNFKSDYRYNRIVGMSNKDQFDKWDEYFKQNMIDNIETYKKNDISISPEMYDSELFGKMSASTLRYIFTSNDIKNTFKNIKTVLEIGIGYGGLCYILSNMIGVDEYKLVDVDIVKQFSAMYLESLNQTNFKIEHDGVSDLLVSEFCFSEFDDSMMTEFYENYIKKTNNIYLVMNLHDLDRKNYWKRLLSEEFHLFEKEEFPKTQWPNYIWYGYRK